MKQISGAEVIQLLPCQNGFIFVEKEEQSEERAVVSYKMVDFERSEVLPVTRSVYLLNKFGNLFEQFEDNPDAFLSLRTLNLSERRLLTVASDGEATVYDAGGRAVWRGEFCYNGATPGGMTADGDGFWVSYPDANCVIRYDGHRMQSRLRLGGDNDAILTPTGLSMLHDRLMVCSREGRQLLQIDPVSFSIDVYHTFDQPVVQYLKYHSKEFVLTLSGIYKL